MRQILSFSLLWFGISSWATTSEQLESMINFLMLPGNVPYCEDTLRQLKFPSKIQSTGECDDGDAALFNGLLCAVGVTEACEAVKKSQVDSTGEWLRSPRFVSQRKLRPTNSFSPDMALGLQVYAVSQNTVEVRRSLLHWLQWIEDNRPCILGAEPNCLRGLPRFCRDDDENGCFLRFGDAVTLARTLKYLNLEAPPVLAKILDSVSGPEDLDNLLLVAANLNDLGYPLHLVAVGIWLARLQGDHSPTLQLAAEKLNLRQPQNPFFAYLTFGPTEEVKKQVLAVCPTNPSDLPRDKVEWAWERADSAQAWKNSMLWDCIFMARLLSKTSTVVLR